MKKLLFLSVSMFTTVFGSQSEEQGFFTISAEFCGIPGYRTTKIEGMSKINSDHWEKNLGTQLYDDGEVKFEWSYVLVRNSKTGFWDAFRQQKFGPKFVERTLGHLPKKTKPSEDKNKSLHDIAFSASYNSAIASASWIKANNQNNLYPVTVLQKQIIN